MTFKDRIKDVAKHEDLLPELSSFEKKYGYIVAEIATRIKSKRKELGMTQKDFAKFLGVTQGMISKWEGAEYNFTIEKLVELYDKLNIMINIKEKRSKHDIIHYKTFIYDNQWNSSATAGNGTTYQNSYEGECA